MSEHGNYEYDADAMSRSVGPWVVEWCATGEQRGTFHVDTLRTALQSNLLTFMGEYRARYTSPWIILGIFPTAREAGAFVDKLEEVQNAQPAEWFDDDNRISIPATEDPEAVERLRRMPYAEYLASTHWQNIRKEVLKRADHRCQVCNRGGLVDVHHRTYENRGAERFADVIVLCRGCHDLFHRAGKLAKPTQR